MRILGIDPGSRLMGFGVVERSGNKVTVLDHGTISLFHKEYKDIPVDETTPSRLKELFVELNLIIKKHKPQAMAVEKVFFAKNAVSALKLGQARGVVLLCGAINDLEIHEYSVTEIKSIITGHGRADKDQVAKMLELVLGKQDFATADASDALALAVAHAISPASSPARTLPPQGKAAKDQATSLQKIPRSGAKRRHSMKDIFTAKLAKKV